MRMSDEEGRRLMEQLQSNPEYQRALAESEAEEQRLKDAGQWPPSTIDVQELLRRLRPDDPA